MPPKDQTKAQSKGPSDEERKQEASQAAKKAREYQAKAKELTQAAAGAGDPEERQKLLNEALEYELQAESFGKTAKYISSGPFQGLAAGAGIGIVPGATLGTLTGTLVGGTTSLITGGLGGAAGTVVGAAHGPWFKAGDVAGDAIGKVTGNLPGWVATDEQKQSLEKMIKGVEETETPKDDELEALSSGGWIGTSGSQSEGNTKQASGAPGEDAGEGKQSWSEYASSYLPSGSKEKSEGAGDTASSEEQKQSWTESAASYMPSWGSGEGAEQQPQPSRKDEPEGRAKEVKSGNDASSAPKHDQKSASQKTPQAPAKPQNPSGSTSRSHQGEGEDKEVDNPGQATFQGMGGADPQAVDALKKRLG